MTREDVREIVEECLARAPLMREGEVRALVRETVRETLVSLGVDQADPIEYQKDMAWLRSLRLSAASARARAGAAAVGILLTAAAAALWTGVRALLRGAGG